MKVRDLKGRYVRQVLMLTFILHAWQPLPGTVWQTDGPLYWLLTAGYLACVGFMLYSASGIDYLDFLGIRTIRRRMRNQPAKPPAFSVKGAHAHCRHPMYLALTIALWTGPVMTYTRLEFAALATLFLFVGTVFEERNLREELGDVYDLYRENVPMWIPRLTPWQYTPAARAGQRTVEASTS